MPSQVTSVPLVRVYDYLKQQSGPAQGNASPIAGRTVTLTLTPQTSGTSQVIATSINPITQLPFVPVQSSVTDSNGYWEAWVVPTDNINPSGMTYIVDDGYRTYKINPTLAGIPGIGWQSSAIITSAPAVLIPAGQTVGNLQVNGTLGVTGAVTLSSLVQGQAVFPGGAGVLSGDSNFFWDNVNKRLGVGTNVPATPLDVNGTSTFRAALTVAAGGLTVTAGGLTVVAGGAAITGNSTVTGTLNVTGAGTFGALLTVSAGGAAITGNSTVTGTLAVSSDITAQARLVFSAASSKQIPGATSHSWRNNADSADNFLMTDTGLGTLRNALSIPPSAGGALAATSYGTVPVKVAESVLGADAASVVFSSLPSSGFRELRTYGWQLRNSNAGTSVAVVQAQFNGDSSAGHYYEELLIGNNTGAFSEQLASAGNFQWGLSAQSGNAAARGGQFVGTIFNPGQSTVDITFITDSCCIVSGSAGVNQWRRTAGAFIADSAALTSITYTDVNSNNIKAGSGFAIEGVP